MVETPPPQDPQSQAMAEAEAAKSRIRSTGADDDELPSITALEEQLHAGADPQKIQEKINGIEERRQNYH